MSNRNIKSRKNPKMTVLEKANQIIYGDREEAYCEPRFNLDTIAALWTVWIQRKFPEVEIGELTAEDVAQMMVLMKSARLMHNPTHVDSLVDQCGYAALQARINDLTV